jgi:hypothetical protein
MEVSLAPVTPAPHPEGLALPRVGTQTPGVFTPPTLALSTSAAWQDKWAQLPQQKQLLLPADITRAKLLQVCEEYTLKR